MRPRELLAAFAASLAAAVVMTWPLAIRAGSTLPWDPRFEPFAGSDTNTWAWNFWWARRAVEGGAAPFFCDAVFPPYGHSLALHTHTFLWGLLSVPLQWLGGLVPAVNGVLLLLFALAATAAFALARELGIARAGAALSGFAWGFSPYFLQKGLVHFNLGPSPWMPLALLLLSRLARTPRGERAWPTALGLGVVGGLSLLTGSLQSVYLASAAAAFVLLAPGAFAGPFAAAERARLLRPGALALGALALWLTARPLLVAWWSEWSSTGGHGDFPALYHPRLLDFLRPPGLHPLFPGLGAAAPVPGAPFPDARPEHAGLFLRFSLLALGLVAGLRVPAARRWLAMSALLLLLAWDPGPEPHGWLSSLYRRVPPFGMLRVSARFLPAALLPLSVAAGAGLELLLSRGARAPAALLALLVAFESWSAPYPAASVVWPRAVLELAVAPRGGSVLKLPFLPGASESMLWQTRHGLDATLSYVARTNPLLEQRLAEEVPELAKLARNVAPDPAGLARDLERLDVRYVLVQERGMSEPERLEELLARVPGWRREPGGEDGVVLWRAER